MIYIPKAVVNISSKDIKQFKHNIDVGAYLKSPTQSSVHSSRYFELQEWLTANVGKHLLGYWDGGQDGYWLLAVDDPQDLVAFKLVFTPL